ncbi:MAG: hypothetical protein PHI05_04115 [Bacilli bacterium]|nr:hypothetical protein [Bacilli bacterium]
MKRFKLLVILLLFIFLIPVSAKASEKVNVHLFYSDDCPHCKKEITLLDKLEKENKIVVYKYELSNSTLYKDLVSKVRKTFNIDNSYVPLTVIGTNHYIGYNDNTAIKIENTVAYYSNKTYQDIVTEIINNQFDPATDEFVVDEIEESLIKIPYLGLINPKEISLPIIAAVIGLVDGFNPCAMWVLLFLISTLIGMKSKKRMWILGLTFIITSAFIYLLFMASWLKVAVTITSVTWMKILIGVVAITAGLVNLKSYLKKLKEEDGCTVVDDKKRNKIIDKIKKVTTEKSLVFALIGIMALAISVNIIELACSAGLPLLFTQILAMNDLNSIQYVIYMLIYILFFLIDDIIIFAIAMVTLELTGVSTKYSKYSHLIGGIIMIIIGLLLLFNPSLLSFNI